MPSTCAVALWGQQRFLAAVGVWTQKGINYCHHHVPNWPPPSGALSCSGTGSGTTTGGVPGNIDVVSQCACYGFVASPRPNPRLGVGE